MDSDTHLSHIAEDMETDDKYKMFLPDIINDIINGIGKGESADHLGFPSLPSNKLMIQILEVCETILYPGYFGDQHLDRKNVNYYIGSQVDKLYGYLSRQIGRCLMHKCVKKERTYCGECIDRGKSEAYEFIKKIPDIRKKLWLDIQAAYKGDPAAKDFQEIIFCYPGLKAITIYRIAHEFYKSKIPFLPRMMSEYAHSITGCDIHSGAKIGESFFIDHATGVVIGETTWIGNNVRIYQGVTLGSLRFPKDKDGNIIRDAKRHPTIEDDVIIYANSTILGGETVIGKGSVIGGNVWLTESVPVNTKITSEPSKMKIKLQK